jgi:hypothetical protein
MLTMSQMPLRLLCESDRATVTLLPFQVLTTRLRKARNRRPG